MSIKAEIEELLGPNVVDDYWVRDAVVLLLRAELARQVEAERQAETGDRAPHAVEEKDATT
jgi:hypothetical protein